MNVDQSLLSRVIPLVSEAAEAILSVYHHAEGFNVDQKADHSPVTEADLMANRILAQGLSAIDPSVPVLTEESELPPFELRQQWRRYWLVDPLDGTKEFISRNGEFTVNVALIDGGKPVLGVVCVPTSGVIYTGMIGGGAYKLIEDNAVQIGVRRIQDRISEGLPIALISSRHHGAAAVEAICQQIKAKFGGVEKRSIGSSLKFCLVAEGEADLYLRYGPTSEWDTAAAQTIVEAAGGHVVTRELQPLIYNTKASIINSDFYVLGDAPGLWVAADVGL